MSLLLAAETKQLPASVASTAEPIGSPHPALALTAPPNRAIAYLQHMLYRDGIRWERNVVVYTTTENLPALYGAELLLYLQYLPK